MCEQVKSWSRKEFQQGRKCAKVFSAWNTSKCTVTMMRKYFTMTYVSLTLSRYSLGELFALSVSLCAYSVLYMRPVTTGSGTESVSRNILARIIPEMMQETHVTGNSTLHRPQPSSNMSNSQQGTMLLHFKNMKPSTLCGSLFRTFWIMMKQK